MQVAQIPGVGADAHENFISSLGVSIIDGEKGQGVIMDLEVQWDGNPKIELDIRTRVGVGLPVQVICASVFMLLGS